MKTGKKLLIGIIAMFTLLLCFTFGASALDTSGQCGDNVYWAFDEATGELVISGEGEIYNSTYDYDNWVYVSPWNEYKDDILSVVIGNGVTVIGDGAFCEHSNLSSVDFSNSVLEIGYSAFNNCRNLESVEIPDSVKVIGGQSFANCKRLNDLSIGEGVEILGLWAFVGCESLEEITIPDSVKEIYESFDDTGYYNNVNNWDEDGLLYIGKYLIAAGDYFLDIEFDASEYRIKEGTRGIAHAVFFSEKLTKLIIPESVENISSIYEYCPNLTEIVVNENNKSFCADDGILFDKEKSVIVAYPSSKNSETYRIPDSVCEINDYAFRDCKSLKEIVFPSSVNRIGIGTCKACENLKSIIIPNSVKSIGNSAFDYCESLSDVYYLGAEDEWNCIVIDEYNENLTKAIIHFNYEYTANIELNDSNTGVTAKYRVETFDGAANLVVIENGVNSKYEFIKDYELFKSYDISFEINGEKVQPDGMVTIIIPIPVGYSEDDCEIYYIDENGNQNLLNSTCDNGYITFVTNHFSEYVIVDESSKITVMPSPEPVEPDETDGPSNDCSCNCHKTGFSSFIWKFLRFFYKLFKINPLCECGSAHY